MRRQDIRLISMARHGDIDARCEVGRRYLSGSDGFPRHVATGMDYLLHPSVLDSPDATRIIAEKLALHQIVELQLDRVLVSAAAAGNAAACIKLGVWQWLRHERCAEGMRMIEAAAAGGHFGAMRALDALRARTASELPIVTVLRALQPDSDFDARMATFAAASQSLRRLELPPLLAAIGVLIALGEGVGTDFNELVAGAVRIAERTQRPLTGLAAGNIEQCLDHRARHGDNEAAYVLGRALCDIACGSLEPSEIAARSNIRKGAALLLRAADAGYDDAWLHLYGLHSDRRLSVANPLMARFFLEKSAARGNAEAQRKLGALILRSSGSLPDSEHGISWLHKSAAQGDALAARLMSTLVLPASGCEDAAEAAIGRVQLNEPWLAARMRLARDFGLTKLEALSVDPVSGARPWGLSVGKNPFIVKSRLSAGRAIPAATAAAHETLRRTIASFSSAQGEPHSLEGDMRRRSLIQRRAFSAHSIDESLFFSSASSTALEQLRDGPKWAYQNRSVLQLALAASSPPLGATGHVA